MLKGKAGRTRWALEKKMPLELSFSNPWGIIAIAVALGLGGILKGVTGAGVPVVAVPIIAAVYDIKIAVALLVVPNLVTNLSQAFKYRDHALEKGFAFKFSAIGALGAGLGTVLLAYLPTSILSVAIAVIIFAYIGLRLTKPDLQLSLPRARKLLWPAGLFGGILQGAVGVSAPVSVTFLNSMRIARPQFIFNISVFFAAMCVVQLPVQISYGLMNWNIAIFGLLAIIPLFATIPIGEWIGKRLSPLIFDRAILVVLAALAIRLIWVAVS